MIQLGGHADLPGARRHPARRARVVADIARNLERWVDVIVARTFRARDRSSSSPRTRAIPVINGLSDLHHPCQVLADCFTLRRAPADARRAARRLHRRRQQRRPLVDGGGGAASGFAFALACPPGYEPDAGARRRVRARAAPTIEVTTTVRRRASRERRRPLHRRLDEHGPGGRGRRAPRRASRGYQVNDAADAPAPSRDALVMHCLPAHRGEEITGDVHRRAAVDRLRPGGEPPARAEGV